MSRTTAASVLTIALLAACERSPSPRSRVYVSDETGGTVVAIDPVSGQILHRIAVGKRPRGIRISRDGTRLFVALSGSPIAGPGVDESKLPPPDRTADGIGVIDLATHKVVRTYSSGQDPEAFDISPDGKTLFVSNEDAAQMSALDLASGNVLARVQVGGEPEGVAVRPDGREVYVSCEADNEVVAVDTTTFKAVARMKVGPRPRAIVFSADGSTAFVTIENGAAVDVIDTRQHAKSGTIEIPRTEGTPTAPRPMGAVLSPDGRQLFVSLGRARSIAAIDVVDRKAVRSIEDVGMRPWGIGLSSDGRKGFTANGGSGDVSVIDIASGKVEKRIAVGGSPWGIALTRFSPAVDGASSP